MRNRIHVFLLLILTLTASTFAADADLLAPMAQKIADQIAAKPTIDSSAYSLTFLKAVPEAQLADLYRKLYAQNGDVRSVLLQSRQSPTSAKFIFRFSEVDIHVSLNLETEDPHRVTGLWFGAPVARIKSLDELTKRLAKLPGTVSFQMTQLSDEKVLASLNADTPLAIGSAFKLYILATLANDNPDWAQVTTLKSRYKSLPSGDMQKWPDDSPVTIHTLALKMISQSDNTATDHLLAFVGRNRIEALLPTLGMKSPALNTPFLSTREMFQLKADASLRNKYIAASASDRNTMLKEVDARALPDKIDLSKPTAIGEIEWFASAADLTRTLQWINKKNDTTTLMILAVNPGLPVPENKFSYVGYKGGSEPGVLNLTWLLRSKNKEQTAYVLTATWNNPAAPLEEEKLFSLLEAAFDLVPTSPDR